MPMGRTVLGVIAAGIVAGAVVGWSLRHQPPQRTLLEVPVRDRAAAIDGDGAVLINGRLVTPAGRVFRTRWYAWGMAVLPMARAWPWSVRTRSRSWSLDAAAGHRMQIAVRGADPGRNLGAGPYMGCAFSLGRPAAVLRQRRHWRDQGVGRRNGDRDGLHRPRRRRVRGQFRRRFRAQPPTAPGSTARPVQLPPWSSRRLAAGAFDGPFASAGIPFAVRLSQDERRPGSPMSACSSTR